ncbi:hypothetical protein [Burkholderia pseudomultivorans]|uniref:hypothetical protein n=1 Tax=Burkholderia pseudomultivorans TaxID=1207504 RepID=UPI001E364E93|nr:hypothetical protein [Burkholderia pseudomultivorans]
MNKRELRARELSLKFPANRDELLAVALDAVRELHAAVVDDDAAAAEAASDRYDAVVWRLNGDTFFGCRVGAGEIIEQHCRAEAGHIPMWGQAGEFLINVSGVRSIVEVDDGFGRFRVFFKFHAVDVNKQFISETGFRSHFEVFQSGQTVDEVAKAIFAAFLAKGRTMIDPDRREDLESKNASKWPWLATTEEAAGPHVETTGQFAFGF